jgi:hypothetical protein
MHSRSLRIVLPLLLLGALLSPSAAVAGPDALAHGVTSTNVEHVKFIPFEPYSATGARIVGNYLYVTSWKNLSIYDITVPEDPQLVSITPWAVPTTDDPTPDPHRFENEDVATNGKILIFSETGATLVGGGTNHYRVYDVTDKAAPKQIANVPGIAQHTMTCLNNCQYTYGSSGNIVDLTDPTKPKLVANWAVKSGAKGGHDVREVASGLVAVSSSESAILDVSDPLNPRKIATAAGTGAKPAHSTWWDGKDRFLLGGQETNLNARCTGTIGATTVFDMSNYTSGSFGLLDTYRVKNGYAQDGSPVANGLGCSSHWLEANPTFSNGGLFAQGYYEHGTRFFFVGGEGKLTEVGHFLPNGGSTSAVHWANNRVLYAIDYLRGFDVLKWNGPLTNSPGAATEAKGLKATRSGSAVTVSGTGTFAGEATATMLGTDAAGDGPARAEVADATGVDLLGASIRQPESGYPYLDVTWKVSNLPGPDTAPATAPEVIRYVASFAADDVTYQVQAKLSNLTSLTQVDDPAGHATHVGKSFQLRGNCGTLVAVSNCAHLAWLDGTFDVARKEIRVRVPVGSPVAPAIKPGAVITAPTSGVTAPFIYATYQAVVSNANTWDAVEYEPELSYSVPQGTIAVGSAATGTDPANVSFGAPAAVGADGAFTKTLPSVASGHDVFVKACFGTSCSVRTIAGG